MAEIIKAKKYLLVKKYQIVKFLDGEGYNGEDIGFIMNLNRSQISRILTNGKNYKDSVRKLLSDSKS